MPCLRHGNDKVVLQLQRYIYAKTHTIAFAGGKGKEMQSRMKVQRYLDEKERQFPTQKEMTVRF